MTQQNNALAMFEEMDKASSGSSIVESINTQKIKPKNEEVKSKVIRNLPVDFEKKFNFIKGMEVTDSDFSEYIRTAIKEKIERDLQTIENQK
jgi:hypothetical protein